MTAFQFPAGLLLARLLVRGGVGGVVSALASVGVNLALASIFLRKLLYWSDDARDPWWRVWLFEVPYAFYGAMCFMALPFAYFALVTLGLWNLFGTAPPTVIEVLGPLYAVTGAFALWASSFGRLHPVVRRYEVTIEGLSPALEGYRIAQLSDVHCGPYLPRGVYRSWVARALALKPDAFALTGDLINAGEGYLADVTDLVTHMKAPDGVFACMGNHDYFSTTEGVADAVKSGGARLLRNEHTFVRRGDATLCFAGIDDRWTKRDDLDRALAGVPDGVPVVLLAHDPESFRQIAEHPRKVDLTLSGHTHGGQFAVPFLSERLNLARVAHRYTAGIYRLAGRTLYVHRGMGTSGPPVRFGVPPEVVLVTLRAG